MNAVFTIVAKNYFPLAKCLARSIRHYHQDLDVIIGIADHFDESGAYASDEYIILKAEELGIEKYENMAFKYNVTEFCTAVKPFFFDHLFKSGKYEKLIYFDPDILLYNRLDAIFESLENKSVVLTPHFVTPQLAYTGNAPETALLFAGIYNLGFAAFRNTPQTATILDWWKVRLETLCYADKFDALHVDQKWMDFIPAFFPSETVIQHSLGWNVAYWNIHEREFIRDGGSVSVRNRLNPGGKDDLLFIHFSGVDPHNIYVNKQCPRLDLNNYPDWIPFMEEYAATVKTNDWDHFMALGYSFNTYSNGTAVLQFHRRLYRRITDKVRSYDQPFNVDGEFYRQLGANGLLAGAGSGLDKMNERNMEGFDRKLKMMNRASRILKKTLGMEKYVLLLKFCQRYFRPENQTFLIKEMNGKVPFLNETVQ